MTRTMNLLYVDRGFFYVILYPVTWTKKNKEEQGLC